MNNLIEAFVLVGNIISCTYKDLFGNLEVVNKFCIMISQAHNVPFDY
jgi:hypothetical protein